MSGLAYGALAAVGVVFVVWFALWLGMRAARKAGGAEAEAGAAKKVAENARAANEVRGRVAGVDDAGARERLRRWERD